MNKIILLFTLSFTLTSFISCSDNAASKKNDSLQNNDSGISDSLQVDTTYMYTGFYFLTGKDNNGVNMKVENSNRFYSLYKTPFASVVNIKQTALTTTKLEQGEYTELCITFDSKGTKDLEQGTGNASQPQIAVVIAGRLLYVVGNSSKIKNGVICIGLVGYSMEEMVKIKAAVDQKN